MNTANYFLVALGVTLTSITAPAMRSMADTQSAPTPETKVGVATSHEGLRLNLHFNNIDVVDALKTISKQGNIEVIVRDTVHGKVWNVRLDGITPEDALEQVCTATGLSWTIQNKTYIISKKLPKALPIAKAKPRISLEFQETSVAEILAMVGEQGHIHVILGSTVIGGEKLNYIRLNNETPEDAIQKISQAAGLMWKKLDDKTYSITKPERRLESSEEPRA